MKKISYVMMLSITLTLGTTSSLALPPLPDTFFTVSLVNDETGKIVDPPAYLGVEEVLNGEVINQYRLPIYENPITFDIPWSTQYRQENTIVKIHAGKDGYNPSDVHTYTITSNARTSGLLFEHEFRLKPIQSMEKSEVTVNNHDISFEQEKFNVRVETASEVEVVEFTQTLKELTFIVNERSAEGLFVVTIPNRLLGSPFSIWVDGSLEHMARQELGDEKSVISINYSGGIHTIRIVGSTVIPEFPFSAVIVMGIVVGSTVAIGRFKKPLGL